jgi:hypothetical protein
MDAVGATAFRLHVVSEESLRIARDISGVVSE